MTTSSTNSSEMAKILVLEFEFGVEYFKLSSITNKHLKYAAPIKQYKNICLFSNFSYDCDNKRKSVVESLEGNRAIKERLSTLNKTEYALQFGAVTFNTSQINSSQGGDQGQPLLDNYRRWVCLGLGTTFQAEDPIDISSLVTSKVARIKQTATADSSLVKLKGAGPGHYTYTFQEFEAGAVSQSEAGPEYILEPIDPLFDGHPCFSDPETVAVFQDFHRTKDVLDICCNLFTEAKMILDISKAHLKETSTNPKGLKSEMRFPFVVVEGLDGSGKTTLSENLGQFLGEKTCIFHTPPEYTLHIRKTFDAHPELIRRSYYSLGNYMVAGDIAKQCHKTPVIMDRFWHSTAAYAIAHDSAAGDLDNHTLPPSGHWVYNWPRDLLKPDVVIFLTVSEGVRKERIKQRDEQETVEEKKLRASDCFRERLQGAYCRMDNPPCIEISADGSRQQVLDLVINKLKQLNIIEQ